MRTPFWLSEKNVFGFLLAPIFKTFSIAPVVGGALIVAGSSLISGIMGGLSEAQRRKQELMMQANQQEYDARMRSAENQTKNQQNAFSQLMDTYKHSLT